MKNIFKIALLSILGLGASAQTLENVNLLNTSSIYGSPRYVAMGGAFTALGNDLSALHINPAGGAVFRHDNFGLSLGFQGQTNNTSFLGQDQDTRTLDVLFQNIGLVKKFGKKDKYFFGLTYNRMADFNSSFNVTGVNAYNMASNGLESGFTLGEYWLAGANGFTVGELEQAGFLEEASAASASILLTDQNTGEVIAFDYVDDAANVSYNYSETGNRNEIAINFGGEVNKTLYWGGGIGIPTLSYTGSGTLTESGFQDTSYFSAVDLMRSNSVDAYGINLKMGLIFKPTQWLRLGASYQSPSWYRVNEIYTVTTSGYERSTGAALAGTEYIFDDISYGVTTPAIYRVGLATVIAKRAIISADLERSNPSNTTLTAKDNSNYEGDQDRYQQNTQKTLALKLGAELRFGPAYLRGGFQHRESNFIDADIIQSDLTTISGGFGYKKGRFGVDVTYIHSNYSASYLAHPYLAFQVDGSGNGIEGGDIDRATVQNEITKGSVVLGINLSF